MSETVVSVRAGDSKEEQEFADDISDKFLDKLRSDPKMFLGLSSSVFSKLKFHLQEAWLFHSSYLALAIMLASAKEAGVTRGIAGELLQISMQRSSLMLGNLPKSFRDSL